MSQYMEVELKLLLDPSYVRGFRRHPLLKKHAVGNPGTRQLLSIYFDTPDLFLRKHESALRVRKAGRRWVQTFKAGGQVESGLHQRHEWESAVKGASFDLNTLIDLAERGTPWGKILSDPCLANFMKPIFTTRFRRTTWVLSMDSGAEIELVLDQGVVQYGEAQETISEIELELKSGDPASLFDLALELQHDIPLRASNVSKADRGYSLLMPRSLGPAKAVKLEIPEKTTLEQGFEAIVRNCLTQVQANEAAVEQGNPEGVHQMRVGLRRLRSALRLFDEVISCPEKIRAELNWLASELGDARDWRVFSATMASVMRSHPEMKSLAKVQDAASAMARLKEEEAAESANSLRYSRLMLLLGAWISGRRWRGSLEEGRQNHLAEKLDRFAENTLARTRRRLLKRGRMLRKGTPADRHKIRIAAKRARYCAEFFQSLYSSKRMRRYIEALADLQESIGQYHDDITAVKLLGRLAQSRPDLAQSYAFVEGFLDERISRWEHEAVAPWHEYTSRHLPRMRR